MKAYRFYFELKPWDGNMYIHVIQQGSENTKHYFTFEGGKVMAHTIGACESIPDGSNFLELPFDLFIALKDALVERAEQEGGAPTQQSLRGEVKRLEDENKWLRSIVEVLPYRDTRLPDYPKP